MRRRDHFFKGNLSSTPGVEGDKSSWSWNETEDEHLEWLTEPYRDPSLKATDEESMGLRTWLVFPWTRHSTCETSASLRKIPVKCVRNAWHVSKVAQ